MSDASRGRRRRSREPRPPLSDSERETVIAAGRAAGLDRVGTCSVTSWTATRSVIEVRRTAGLASGMEFTYRNPARSTEPGRVMRSAASLFVATRPYAQTATDPESELSATDAPARVARYASSDHYERLESGLGAMAAALRGLGHRAVAVADTNAVVDREAAWRAGLGWFGKNSLVLAPGAGSWFVIGSVVTDAVVRHVARPVADGCGGCVRCIDGCPTGAIVAPGVVDSRRCLSWLLQAPGPFPVAFRRSLGVRIYGCDDCQEVCPPNRTLELRSRRDDPWPVERDPGSWLGACELLETDDIELLRRCRRWYIHQRDPDIVRRNLLIVLANAVTSDPRTTSDVVVARIEGLLRRYRSHGDPVLRETAEWALNEVLSVVRSRLAPVDGADEDGRR